jgi:hypothetical protein
MDEAAAPVAAASYRRNKHQRAIIGASYVAAVELDD